MHSACGRVAYLNIDNGFTCKLKSLWVAQWGRSVIALFCLTIQASARHVYQPQTVAISPPVSDLVYEPPSTSLREAADPQLGPQTHQLVPSAPMFVPRDVGAHSMVTLCPPSSVVDVNSQPLFASSLTSSLTSSMTSVGVPMPAALHHSPPATSLRSTDVTVSTCCPLCEASSGRGILGDACVVLLFLAPSLGSALLFYRLLVITLSLIHI